MQKNVPSIVWKFSKISKKCKHFKEVQKVSRIKKKQYSLTSRESANDRISKKLENPLVSTLH